MTEDRIITLADMRDPDDPAGRSYRQVNAAKTHGIPLRALVEIEDTGERLYVVLQGRDCNQTPAYWLAIHDYFTETHEGIRAGMRTCGYPEHSLTVIRLPETSKSG
jgi:hypothetical protein